jgi:hypothetical protein
MPTRLANDGAAADFEFIGGHTTQDHARGLAASVGVDNWNALHTSSCLVVETTSWLIPAEET